MSRGNPYTYLTKEQIRYGAQEKASNSERFAFFAHSYVATGNLAGFLISPSIMLMIIDLGMTPLTFDITILIGIIIFTIIPSAIIGTSMLFYQKVKQLNKKTTEGLMTFSKEELKRPLIIGSLYGIGIVIFYSILKYCITQLM